MRDSSKLKLMMLICLMTLTVSFLPFRIAHTQPETQIGPSIRKLTDFPATKKIAPNLLNLIESKDNASQVQVIVVLKQTATRIPILDALDKIKAKVKIGFHLINAMSAVVQAGKLRQLALHPDVEKILLDGRKYVIPPPLDQNFSRVDAREEKKLLPGYTVHYSQFPFWIDADEVWNEKITGRGVTVAILDTGVFFEHPDLIGAVIGSRVFTSETGFFPHDGFGHGTACAGLVASRGIVPWDIGVPGYRFKVKGVAPSAKILAGKVLDDTGYGFDSWIIQGIEWAVDRGADIISMSLGGLEVPNNGNDPTSLALDKATMSGVTCFVATGNDQGSGTVASPSIAREVISVGASTENSFPYLYGYWPLEYANGFDNDQVIFWSGAGPTADGRNAPDVVAPGARDLALNTLNGPYGSFVWPLFGGTSMATPIAAGAGALVIEAYREFHGASPTPAVVKEILMSTAEDLGYPPNKQGAGRIDAYQAYRAAKEERFYCSTPSINAGIRDCGESYTTALSFTESVEVTAFTYTATTDLPLGFSFSGKPGETVFSEPFAVGENVDFVDVKVKFDPSIDFGPVHKYNGRQWTDFHINTVLHRIEDGENTKNIMINYAYAHDNLQWFQARVTGGQYALQFNLERGSAPRKEVNFDVQVTLMSRPDGCDWVDVFNNGENVNVEVKAPGETPGTYTCFLEASDGTYSSLIPVSITVPLHGGSSMDMKFNVPMEPGYDSSGDWQYIPVKIEGERPLTLTATWKDPDADFDVYLIDPSYYSKSHSLAPVAPRGPGLLWYTTTGEASEVITAGRSSPGWWLVGVHNTFFGNAFSETLTLKVTTESPLSVPSELTIRPRQTKDYVVSNTVGTLHVDTEVLRKQTAGFAYDVSSSIDSWAAGGMGFELWEIQVGPETTKFSLRIDWSSWHKLQLVLYDPTGQSVKAVASQKGQTITVGDPTVGSWFALVTISTPTLRGVDYTLHLSGTAHIPFSEITVKPSSFTATTGYTAIKIGASKTATGDGYLVLYDYGTGSVYGTTNIAVKP